MFEMRSLFRGVNVNLSLGFAILFFGLNASAALETDIAGTPNGIYKAAMGPVNLSPIAVILNEQFEEPSDAPIPIEAGEELAVQFDDGNAIVTLSDSRDSDSPSAYIIPRDQFAQLNLSFARPGIASDLTDRTYEVASQGKFVGKGHRGSRAHGHARGRRRMVLVANGKAMAWGCVAYVYSKIGGLQGTRPGNGKDVTRNLVSTHRFHYLNQNICRTSPPENAIASLVRRRRLWSYGHSQRRPLAL